MRDRYGFLDDPEEILAEEEREDDDFERGSNIDEDDAQLLSLKEWEEQEKGTNEAQRVRREIYIATKFTKNS